MQPQQTKLEKWAKILPKGLLTIPKSMRERLNLREGEVVRIRIIGTRAVIEPRETVDEDILTDAQLQRILEKDTLPPAMAKATEKYWSKFNLS